jgi:hypothetical protein
MKYAIIILILIISSCNLTGELYISDWELPVKINTIQEALDYVDDNYNYVEKSGVFLPEEFYDNPYGDCEDFALMFQFILETKLNIKSDLVGGYHYTSWHMWVESEGVIYEPTAGITNNYPDQYEELYRWDYIEAMREIQAYGGFIK